MLCDIEVQDTPTVVTDDEKAIERAEGDRRNSEEVHRGNRFAVITEKDKPAPGQSFGEPQGTPKVFVTVEGVTSTAWEQHGNNKCF
jgi:hypothetical protein